MNIVIMIFINTFNKERNYALLYSNIYGENGKIGGTASITAGAKVGDVGRRNASLDYTRNLGRIYFAEGIFSYDIDEGTLQGLFGGGIGISGELEMYTGSYSYNYDYGEIHIKLVSPSYPMTVAEWGDHLGRK